MADLKKRHEERTKRHDYHTRRRIVGEAARKANPGFFGRLFHSGEEYSRAGGVYGGEINSLYDITSDLALSDQYRKKGDLEKSMGYLEHATSSLSPSINNRYITRAEGRKLAQAILSRAYRISNVAAGNLKVDKKAINIAEDIRHIYQIKPHKALEHAASAAALIAGMIGSLFFLSPGITGNVIGYLPAADSTLIGTAIFIAGVALAFILAEC